MLQLLVKTVNSAKFLISGISSWNYSQGNFLMSMKSLVKMEGLEERLSDQIQSESDHESFLNINTPTKSVRLTC